MKQNNKEESEAKSKGETESWRAEEEHQAIWNCWAVIYLRDARKDTSRSSKLIAPGYGGRGTSVIWWLSDRARWLYTAQLSEWQCCVLNQRKFPSLHPPQQFFSAPNVSSLAPCTSPLQTLQTTSGKLQAAASVRCGPVTAGATQTTKYLMAPPKKKQKKKIPNSHIYAQKLCCLHSFIPLKKRKGKNCCE